MTKTKSFDQVFFIVALLLLGTGLFILGSASMGLSVRQFGQPYYYLMHQILLGLLPGLFLLWIGYRTPYNKWKIYALPMLFISIVLTSLVFVKGFGLSHGGATRWLIIGPITMQPSELLKFAYIVYLAAWFETKSKNLGSFIQGTLPFIIMNGFVASFLIFQRDIGTLGVLMASAMILFIVSGSKWRQIVGIVILFCIAFGILALMEPYRIARITTFLNPLTDPQGAGYQSRQALIAIGSGGIFGRGFALSRQKFSFLPEPMGDSIFAIAAEELGFLGSIIIISLYVLFYIRGISIAQITSDVFGKLFVSGLLSLILFQAFINISAISGLAPLTGIPLPFISYGGTALAITMGEIGILLNISKTKQR